MSLNWNQLLSSLDAWKCFVSVTPNRLIAESPGAATWLAGALLLWGKSNAPCAIKSQIRLARFRAVTGLQLALVSRDE